MSRTPSPVRPAVVWPYTQCQCSRCVSKELSPGTVCPCKECQPGPGIDHSARLGVRTLRRRARLKVLLEKNDTGGLDQAEETELDDLCHTYLFGD